MRIAILGADGLVGEALSRNLKRELITIRRKDVDIRETKKLRNLLKKERIDMAINCAAYVGGIEMNRMKPYTMFKSNIEITQSVINACIEVEIGEMVLFGSNCMYPKNAKQPFREEDLFKGESVETNQGYAAAKIAGIQSSIAANKEYGINIYHPIPCSLYGYRDNYDLNKSHFVAAAIRKISNAASKGSKEIVFWGSGKPYREILFADEIAEAIEIIVKNKIVNRPINIGTGVDTPIKKVIESISKLTNYKGEIKWDITKPDGALHKLLDNQKIKELGWKTKYTLEEGLEKTLKYYNKGEGLRI